MDSSPSLRSRRDPPALALRAHPHHSPPLAPTNAPLLLRAASTARRSKPSCISSPTTSPRRPTPSAPRPGPASSSAPAARRCPLAGPPWAPRSHVTASRGAKGRAAPTCASSRSMAAFTCSRRCVTKPAPGGSRCSMTHESRRVHSLQQARPDWTRMLMTRIGGPCRQAGRRGRDSDSQPWCRRHAANHAAAAQPDYATPRGFAGRRRGRSPCPPTAAPSPARAARAASKRRQAHDALRGRQQWAACRGILQLGVTRFHLTGICLCLCERNGSICGLFGWWARRAWQASSAQVHLKLRP